MSIGETIKRLRKEKELTQEMLAEYLGISAQAVSQWECCKSAPDIYQLPVIADVFNVSIDVLLEFDIGKKNYSIDAVIKATREKYIKNALWEEAVTALREALKKHPTSHKLMYELSNAIVCYNSANKISDYEEVCSLCSRILSQSTDSVLRYKTLSMLATAYDYSGDRLNMQRIAQDMSPACESKESFMLWRNIDADGIRANKEYLHFLICEILQVLQLFSHSAQMLSHDEQIAIGEQAIKLIDAMFPDGDYEIFAQFADSICARLATLYHEKGDNEQFFYWLNRYCDFSVYTDNYNDEGVHTSPALCGVNFSGWIGESGVSRCLQNSKNWNGAAYDDIRNDTRFISAMERLK